MPRDAAGKLLLEVLKVATALLSSPTPAGDQRAGRLASAPSGEALLKPSTMIASDAMLLVSTVHADPASFAALQEVILNIGQVLCLAPAKHTELQQISTANLLYRKDCCTAARKAGGERSRASQASSPIVGYYLKHQKCSARYWALDTTELCHAFGIPLRELARRRSRLQCVLVPEARPVVP